MESGEQKILKNFLQSRHFQICKKIYEDFAKFLTERKYLMNNCEAKISFDEIIKSINSQINNKSPGNNGLTAEFYKHFSNELASSCPFRCLWLMGKAWLHGCYF